MDTYIYIIIHNIGIYLYKSVSSACVMCSAKRTGKFVDIVLQPGTTTAGDWSPKRVPIPIIMCT